MNNFSIRTDLAIEIAQMLTKSSDKKLSGVSVENLKTNRADISLSWVKIENEQGEELMGRPIGNYITLESQTIKENDTEAHEEIIKALGDCLGKLLNLKENSSILVIGLGNRNITPDALGPKVISKILVTRHIKETLPEQIDNAVRPVSAISPGVMGITGIETAEIIKGISQRIKPDYIIAIDALAARCSSRINTTIQISDTGVCPRLWLRKQKTGLKQGGIRYPRYSNRCANRS